MSLASTNSFILPVLINETSNFQTFLIIFFFQTKTRRSQWPRLLRRRSTTARLLRSWVRIPPGAWKFVCCECCVLSGRGLCDELFTRPEESYRLWCVVVCDLETSWIRRLWPALDRGARGTKKLRHTVSLSQTEINNLKQQILID